MRHTQTHTLFDKHQTMNQLRWLTMTFPSRHVHCLLWCMNRTGQKCLLSFVQKKRKKESGDSACIYVYVYVFILHFPYCSVCTIAWWAAKFTSFAPLYISYIILNTVFRLSFTLVVKNRAGEKTAKVKASFAPIKRAWSPVELVWSLTFCFGAHLNRWLRANKGMAQVHTQDCHPGDRSSPPIWDQRSSHFPNLTRKPKHNQTW